MDEKDAEKTTIVTHHGLYCCTRMQFSMENASRAFQRVLDVTLVSVKRKSAIIFINDVVIFSKMGKQHLRTIDEVLRLLRGTEMTMELKECHFILESVEQLGRVNATRKLEVAKPTTEKIGSLRCPKNTSQVRFLYDCEPTIDNSYWDLQRLQHLWIKSLEKGNWHGLTWPIKNASWSTCWVVVLWSDLCWFYQGQMDISQQIPMHQICPLDVYLFGRAGLKSFETCRVTRHDRSATPSKTMRRHKKRSSGRVVSPHGKGVAKWLAFYDGNGSSSFEMDFGPKQIRKHLAQMRLHLLKLEFDGTYLLWMYRRAAESKSRPPKTIVEKEKSVADNIPYLSTLRKNELEPAIVCVVWQEPVKISDEEELLGAQEEDPWYRDLKRKTGIELSSTCHKAELPYQKSSIDGSIHVVTTSGIEMAVL